MCGNSENMAAIKTQCKKEKTISSSDKDNKERLNLTGLYADSRRFKNHVRELDFEAVM